MGANDNNFFWAASTLEPKRQYKFLISIPRLNNSRYYATKAGRPGVKIGETPHKYLNHTFYYPGVAEWDPVTISFVDPGGANDMTQGLYNALIAMGYTTPTDPNMVTQRTITKASATEVFNQIEIQTLDATGARNLTPSTANTEVSETWTLKNAWPTDIKWGELDYSGDGMVALDVTFRYDWAENTKGTPTS
jgi:hypothetical protein|tara:strand:+ start:5003 stop:5578 length:576 start_codon:yes stop_codon:yes gene_type:complete